MHLRQNLEKVDPYAELDHRADAYIELRRVRKLKKYHRITIHVKGAPNGS